MTWEESVKLAKHYLAIEQTRIHLYREEEYPWLYVTKIESGSLHRFNASVSISFEAEHPCGLTFAWSIDMEDKSSNGTSHFKVDVLNLRKVLTKLPKTQRARFAGVVSAAADHVDAQSVECETMRDKLANMARQMRSLV